MLQSHYRNTNKTILWMFEYIIGQRHKNIRHFNLEKCLGVFPKIPVLPFSLIHFRYLN